jgi:hypothetical protein
MKLLLDTNVWSYIADAQALQKLLGARRRNMEFLVAPASVAEARGLSDAKLRKRLLAVMTHSAWKRLMAETYLESEEIKQALQAARPDWAIDGDQKDFKRFRHYFLRSKGGFWDGARDDATLPVTDESLREHAENALARQEVRDIRDRFKYGAQTGATEHLQKNMVDVEPPLFEARSIEYWRLESAHVLRNELCVYASPYRECLDCFLNVEAMLKDTVGFNHVWFSEVRPEQLKRQWLRSSMNYLQRWHKPTDGSPADSQLASHLIDADYFVTADKNFAQCINKIHAEAPFATAKPLKISASTAGIEELVAFAEQSRQL